MKADKRKKNKKTRKHHIKEDNDNGKYPRTRADILPPPPILFLLLLLLLLGAIRYVPRSSNHKHFLQIHSKQHNIYLNKRN